MSVPDKSIVVRALSKKFDWTLSTIFKELRTLMTERNILKNPNEGEHRKLFVWKYHIQVQGNDQKFAVQPELLTAGNYFSGGRVEGCL